MVAVPLGTLSADQARYAAAVTQATGLDPNVVVAWVGTESGWGVNKPDHNYLNVGPGRAYQSVDQAAADAAGLVRSSGYYAGIRSAIPAGPGAQVAAIGASPWGTKAADLSTVWHELVGTNGAATGTVAGGSPPGVVQADIAVPPGVFPLQPPAGFHLPGLGDLASGAASVSGLNKIVPAAASAALELVFVAGALALIGLGLARLTGNSATDMFHKAQQVQDQAAKAAAMAAIA